MFKLKMNQVIKIDDYKPIQLRAKGDDSTEKRYAHWEYTTRLVDSVTVGKDYIIVESEGEVQYISTVGTSFKIVAFEEWRERAHAREHGLASLGRKYGTGRMGSR